MSTQLTPPLSSWDHVIGPADAPVTLVEYGDYECPYCGRAHPIVASILQQTGDHLRFAYRHFPLTRLHPHAEHAAEMAEAAGSRGKFWPMHDLLFQNQHALDDEDLIEYAARLGDQPRMGSVRAPVPPVRRSRAGRFHEWRAQRGERHANLLHKRHPSRRALG
jgi:protein-disulfide isomerase